METRPVDWWGRQVEDASRAMVERVTITCWRREHRGLRLARWGAWLVLVAAVLASTAHMLATHHAMDGVRQRAEVDRQVARETLRAVQVRLCLQFPEWCVTKERLQPQKAREVQRKEPQKGKVVIINKNEAWEREYGKPQGRK